MRKSTTAGLAADRPAGPSRPHVPLEKGGWRVPPLGLRNIPANFILSPPFGQLPHQARQGSSKGSSWEFLSADQGEGYTISGLLAEPQEGQTAPGGVGNFCSTSVGARRVTKPTRSPHCAWDPLWPRIHDPGARINITELYGGPEGREHGSWLPVAPSQRSSADLLTPGLGCNHNSAPRNQNSTEEPPPSLRLRVSDRHVPI